MARARPSPGPTSADPTVTIGFLLSQVGSHASARFAERLEPLGFKPAQVGILRVIREADGLSQQALGERLGVFASRLVGLLDELQKRGLVERRDNPADRRSYALFLTGAGRESLEQVDGLAREHERDVAAALDDAEKERLAEYLRRIAAQQGLTPGVHPGFRKMD